MKVALAVAFGGAIGAILRWWIGIFVSYLQAPVYWGTLAVNIVGSFLVGLFLMWFQAKSPIGDLLRTGILIGLLGGFTTYSAFSMETINLLMAGFYGRAVTYVVMTVVACLMGTWIGVTLGRVS